MYFKTKHSFIFPKEVDIDLAIGDIDLSEK